MTERVPEIRLEGFSGPWEQRKLGDFDIKTGPFGSTLHAEDYVVSGTPIVTTEHFKSGNLPLTGEGIPQVSDMDTQRLCQYSLQRHDIVFSRVGSVDLNAEVKNEQVGWLFSGRVLRVRPDVNIDSTYLHYELGTDRVRNSIVERAVGLTMASINTGILGDTEFYVPTMLEEQRRVGALFQQLDDLITLHQREGEKYARTKKILLDLMFPRDGESEPRLRFDGFTEPWEQRKLGELYIQSGSGGTPPASNPAYYGGLIPFLSIADIEARDIKSTKKTLTELGLQNSAAWLVPAGAVALAMYASVGKVGIIRQDTATSQAFFNMVFDSDELRDFVYYRLEKAELFKEWEPLISTGTQRNLNAEKVQEWRLLIPDMAEMRAIGTLLSSLNDLITLHQRELEKLKKVKSTLLRKMFV